MMMTMMLMWMMISNLSKRTVFIMLSHLYYAILIECFTHNSEYSNRFRYCASLMRFALHHHFEQACDGCVARLLQYYFKPEQTFFLVVIRHPLGKCDDGGCFHGGT